MPLRIPVSAVAAEEIKQLAIRFSKELQSLTGERIRGIRLYDAFVKPLGYGSLNEVNAESSRTLAIFPMREYLIRLRHELRKHLPVPVEPDLLAAALDSAANPGSVNLVIDAREASDNSISTLTKSLFYQDFRKQVFAEGRERQIVYSELLDSPKRNYGEPLTGPIVVTLDYSSWPNENDPLFDWERFCSFIQILQTNAVADNGVKMEILRISRKGDTELFKGLNQYRIPEWKPKICVIDEGPTDRVFAELFNNELGKQLCDPAGNLREAIEVNSNAKMFMSQTEDDYSKLTVGPSSEGKLFLSDRLNPFECASGLEVISLLRVMAKEEADKWSLPEKIAGEMLLKAMAGIVDDFKAEGNGPLDFRVFCDWIGDIPSLLNAPWITDASRDSLTMAYEHAKAADIITSLRLNGYLTKSREIGGT
ncbi:hypothetical protein [Microbulbifer epialgicus]|uniref:Uncharacterized protein n=1 Tax=Microbulbifer epialgicus TaxID=393907 RepID=A0ABV4NUE5_9GAMM